MVFCLTNYEKSVVAFMISN